MRVSAPATIARYDVTITTTSDWSSVTVSPGRFAGWRAVTVPSDVTVTGNASGWMIHSTPSVVRTIVLRAVYEERQLAATIKVSVDKGSIGKTIVDLKNASRSTSFSAAHVLNDMPHPGTPTGASLLVAVSRTRLQMFGSADPPLVRADANRRVLAFYYPWFTATSYDDPTFAEKPRDPYGTVGYPGVLALTQMAHANGVGGFIVSWGGEANAMAFDNVLRAGVETGNVGTAYLEMMVANATGQESETEPADPSIVRDWLRSILSRSSSPAFLRSGGVPVVFVYRMNRLTPGAWASVLDQLAADGLRVRLVGDAPLDTYGAVEWGFHTYSIARSTVPNLGVRERNQMLEARLLSNGEALPHLFAATVSPGYDDTNRRGDANPIVERGTNGERYAGTWEVALNAQPDWVVVTSWNEWFEGTEIQPGQRFGDLALSQTATYAARFRVGTAPRLPQRRG